MTAEQFATAKELDKEIVGIKGHIIDLDDVSSDLRTHEHDRGVKYTTMRIDIGYGKQTPPVNIMDLIHFIDEQKAKYEKEVDRLNKEFSEL